MHRLSRFGPTPHTPLLRSAIEFCMIGCRFCSHAAQLNASRQVPCGGLADGETWANRNKIIDTGEDTMF
jgi:hypothetical protein